MRPPRPVIARKAVFTLFNRTFGSRVFLFLLDPQPLRTLATSPKSRAPPGLPAAQHRRAAVAEPQPYAAAPRATAAVRIRPARHCSRPAPPPLTPLEPLRALPHQGPRPLPQRPVSRKPNPRLAKNRSSSKFFFLSRVSVSVNVSVFAR
jgi:hypothetical protein